MQCNVVRTFFSQIAGKSVSMQIPEADMDFLATSGYVSVMQKEQYDKALAEISNLAKVNEELAREEDEERSARARLEEDERKTHSIFFHFKSEDNQKAELERAESQRNVVSKEEADVVERESKIRELLQKKSMIDRMVQYDGRYVSLTGLGVITLNDLNVRNYRVSETEFPDFIQERMATFSELRSIAHKGGFYVSVLNNEFPDTDLSQLWSVSIGLGKLQGDPNQISERFLLSLDMLQQFRSNLENKMMAAEIMTASKVNPSQVPTNSDLQSLTESLESLEDKARHDAHVPKELSVGVAATILFARRYDGTFPIDKLVEFSKMTLSSESAAILSVLDVPLDQISNKFMQFRSLFSFMGYTESEDTDLASAYLAISDFTRDEVMGKMNIILDALKNYLEYPLVATAILTSIPTLEANETLDLMEKASTLLGNFAPSLERSELISLSVRMIHGIKNELVKELDPTAKITVTPIQFTYVPSIVFFRYRTPLILAHSYYHSTFSAFGGAHPAHVHGFGG
jgi:transcription initiation factor IIE alpha subunit